MIHENHVADLQNVSLTQDGRMAFDTVQKHAVRAVQVRRGELGTVAAQDHVLPGNPAPVDADGRLQRPSDDDLVERQNELPRRTRALHLLKHEGLFRRANRRGGGHFVNGRGLFFAE